ncbi:MAG: patatin-like phospholipase family protein [Betaproteobacteria bacterium]|nr:patatin-like phospholipase family protein [Betaproteobacteria bacterium]
MPRKSPAPRARKPAAATATTKTINLALQGGGAHGAFAWGVLDYLLEDGRLIFDGISGTSAGSMNAVVLAYGLHIGDGPGARTALENFWKAVSVAGQKYSVVRAWPWERHMGDWNNDNGVLFQIFKAMTNTFSPYQLNPSNFNPLRDLLNEQVDFAELNTCTKTKLFLSATNVQTGNVRIFGTKEITADAVMASACLPFLYQAVEIDGHSYWDGGYMGNPALFPLFYETDTRDVLIVHINPIVRDSTPTTPHEIDDRVNEISFNSSLIKEFRAIAFVQKLLDEGWLKDEYRDQMKYVLIHSLRADNVLADLSSASKLCTEWGFLTALRDRGREAAKQWLDQHYDDVGVRQTVDLRAEFLNSGSEMKARNPIAATNSPKRKRASR